MRVISLWQKHLTLLFFTVLAACLLGAWGAGAEGAPEATDPQLVVFGLGEDGVFDAGEDSYLLFADDCVVLRESEGFALAPTGGQRTVGGEGFPEYRGWGGTLPTGLEAGKSVCFVHSGANALPKIELLTVTEVSGNSFTGYAGPPESLRDGSAVSKWILKWVYKLLEKAQLDTSGRIPGIKRHFEYLGMVSLDATFDVGIEVRIRKYNQQGQGKVEMSYCLDLGIPSLQGTMDSKGHSVTTAIKLVDIPLAGVPYLGLNLTVGPALTFDGKGEFQAHVTNTRKTVTYTIYSDGESETEKSSSDGSFELDLASGELDCKIALSTDLAVEALILSAGVSVDTGYRFKVGPCGNEGGNPKENEAAAAGVQTWHLCGPGQCMNGASSFETGWGFAVSAALGPFSVRLTGFDVPLVQVGMYRFYYSIPYGDFGISPYTGADPQGFDPARSFTPCPHMGWRLNVKAVQKNDPSRTVPYATIGLNKAPDYKGRKPTEQAVKANSYFQTGQDGKGVLFLPAGSQAVIRATDHRTASSGELALSKRAGTEDAVIEIDYEPIDIHFFPNTNQQVKSMPESVSAYPGDTVSLKGAAGFPRTEGMDFAGWSEDPNTRWNETEKLLTGEQFTPDRSYTLYAVWKRYFLIRFFDYDHSLIQPKRLPEFSEVSFIGPPPRRPSDEHFDYRFIGWDPPLETTALRDMDYTARYRAICKTFYTVTWTDDEGYLLEQDENVPYLSIPQYNGATPKHSTMTQYYFCGWTPEPGPVTGDITYKAQFSAAPAEMCVVTFEGKGGYLVPAPQPVLRGNRAALPAEKPLRDGYEFAGWQLVGTPYDFSQPVMNDMTLEAAWDRVTYRFTEGDGQTWLNTAEKGPAFTVERNLADEKTYGLFEALYLDGSSLDGTQFTHDRGSLRMTLLPDYARTLAPGEHRLRAVFADGEAEGSFTVANGIYTITYNLGGGALVPGEENPTAYTAEDAFTLKNPVMEGYLFTGWTGTGLRGRSLAVNVPKGSKGNRSYTAHWTLREKCLVLFFDTGDGTASGIPEPIAFDPERSPRVVLPTAIPEKAGWRFLGWNTREDGSGTGYAPGAAAELKGSLALYAQWSRRVPVTGDGGNPALWIGLMLAGIACAAAAVIRSRRK